MRPNLALVPPVTFQVMTKRGPIDVRSNEVFSSKSVALFGMVGAFTPSCHYLHLPGIMDDLDGLTAAGADLIACTCVNDVYVLDAWAKETGASDKILFLADRHGEFARSLDLTFDARDLGLGFRSKRYAMWAVDGAIRNLAVEANPTKADVSSAHSLLRAFDLWADSALPRALRA